MPTERESQFDVCKCGSIRGDHGDGNLLCPEFRLGKKAAKSVPQMVYCACGAHLLDADCCCKRTT